MISLRSWGAVAAALLLLLLLAHGGAFRARPLEDARPVEGAAPPVNASLLRGVIEPAEHASATWEAQLRANVSVGPQWKDVSWADARRAPLRYLLRTAIVALDALPPATVDERRWALKSGRAPAQAPQDYVIVVEKPFVDVLRAFNDSTAAQLGAVAVVGLPHGDAERARWAHALTHTWEPILQPYQGSCDWVRSKGRDPSTCMRALAAAAGNTSLTPAAVFAPLVSRGGYPYMPPMVVALRDAIASSAGLALNAHAAFAPGGFCPPCMFANAGSIECELRDLKNNRKMPSVPESWVVVDVVVAMGAPWTVAIYHQLINSLTRIGAMLDEIIALPSAHILVSNGGPAVDLLVLLGMPRERILIRDSVSARVVVAPHGPHNCGGSAGAVHVQYLRDRLWARLGLSLSAPPRKHVLVLARQYSRRIFNHHELMRTLRGRVPSETFVELSQTDWPRSIRDVMLLVAQAKAVIGAHGAGLSNFFAVAPDTPVLEIMVAPLNTCFVSLAAELQLQYYNAFLDPDATEAGGTVDVDFVARWVQAVV